MKIGEKVPVKVTYNNEDGVATEELDVLPVFTLEDASMGEFKMKTPFEGYFHPAKTGVANFTVYAKDGDVEFLDNGSIVIGGKDAKASKLEVGAPEADVVLPA